MAVVTGVLGELTGTSPTDSWNPAQIVLRAIGTIWAFLVIRRHAWTRLAGFNAPSRWLEPWLIWLPAMLILVNPVNLIGREVVAFPDVARIAAGFAQGFSIALFEETIFRGLVLAILLNRFHSTRAEVIGCAFLSSVLFGQYRFDTREIARIEIGELGSGRR